jgi:cytochrome P450
MGKVRAASSAIGAPGPTGTRALGVWARMFRDPLAESLALAGKYGDAVRLRAGNHTFFLLSRPEHAEHVLVQHQDRYVKSFAYRRVQAFIGEGLATSEGATWQRHRRLVQPVFSRRHVQSFAPAVVAATRQRVAQWVPGGTVDVAAEMRTLTMDIIGRVLLGTDLASDAEAVGRALSRIQDATLVAIALPGVLPPKRVRALATRLIPAMGRAVNTLESLVTRIIDDRIAAAHAEPSDLLDMLLAAGQGDLPLRRDEIQDEVVTLVLAGHDTTANVLTWALSLLSLYPAARDRLAAEVDEVLGDREPQAADVDALVWTQAVVSETMRLYPPVWTIGRDAVVDDNIAGIRVAAGNSVFVAPYMLHRNAEFWPNPGGFDPRRFQPDIASTRPRYAFMPFGAGRRACVGAGLAQMEATLALAVLMHSARLDLLSTVSLQPQVGLTLHPRGYVLAKVAPTVHATGDRAAGLSGRR